MIQKDSTGSESSGKRLIIGYIGQYNYGDVGIEVMEGIQSAAKDNNVDLLCFLGTAVSNDQAVSNGMELTPMTFCNSHNLDGLITWISSTEHYIYKGLSQKIDPELPRVNIGLSIPGTTSLLVDNVSGIRSAMEHLITVHNCKHIAFVKGDDNHQYFRERFQTYCKVLEEHNIPFDERLIIESHLINPSSDSSDSLAKQIYYTLFVKRNLKLKRDIDALVSITDTISVKVMEEFQKHFIKIPDDLIIVGFNNKADSYRCWPSMTTVSTSFYQQGYDAITCLIKKIHKDFVPDTILNPTKLIVRQSCGCFEKTILRIRPISGTLNVMIEPAVIKHKLDLDVEELVEFVQNDCLLKNKEIIGQAVRRILAYLQFGGDYPQLVRNLCSDIKATQTEDNYLLFWQIIVSVLRKQLLPQMKTPEQITSSENLWHQLRMIIFKRLEYLSDEHYNRPLRPTYSLAQIISSFNNVQTIDEFNKLIIQKLPQLNIHQCYFALYDNPNAPNETATIITAYNDLNNSDFSDEPIVFNTSEIIPSRLRFGEPLIIQACYYKDVNLGYVAFSADWEEGFIYESLRSCFCSALYGIFAYQERQNLIKSLTRTNQELNIRNNEFILVNQKLQKSIADVTEANLAKTRFLANISHELRTPLNCIIGFAELIANYIEAEEPAHYLQLITEESQNLIELITQLLDVSKIETGKLKLNIETFNLPELIEYITSNYSAMAHNKGLIYRSHISNLIPEYLTGDPMRLRQIIVNLVGNAIKFTDEGEISLSVEVAKDTLSQIKLKFTIRDTGIGIAEDKQSTIFEAFQQAETSTTRRFGGTGLGTTISKELAELMNGEIGVKSKLGQGSTFWFTAVFGKNITLPVEKEPQHTTEKPQDEEKIAKKLDGRTILLVEDYPTNREVAKAHLRKFNCRIIEAENGLIAIEKFKQNKIDLILMDVQMPEMNGFQATQEIRKYPEGENIPIIGMTANAFDSDVQKCLSCGMNDVITKPVRHKIFLNKIAFCLSKSNETEIPSNNLTNSENESQTAPKISVSNEPFDFDKTVAEFDDNRELVVSLMKDFLENCENQLGIMQKAVSDSESETLFRNAHSIKGGAANLNAYRLSEIAKELETFGKNNQMDSESINKVLADFRDQLQVINDYLKNLNK